MQERIVKIFTGRYIDLDAIISITDAAIDRYTHEQAYFSIICKLQDKPIYHYADLNYSIRDKHERMESDREKLQKEVDKLIKIWKQYRAENP